MKIVIKEIDRLNRLISEFLDFVRPEGAVKQVLDINNVMAEVLDLVSVNKDFEINATIDRDLLATQKIMGNHDKLKQALLNIVINSYQAMAEIAEPALFISTVDKGERVILKIRDVGTGMSEETVKKMFEPFHTTKKKGTGLGLAVTHKILETHGAKVFVESELDKGTEITLEFPNSEVNLSTDGQAGDEIEANDNDINKNEVKSIVDSKGKGGRDEVKNISR